MAGWSQLPGDLLGQIAKRLNILEDCIRIQAVCQTWRGALKDNSSLVRHQQLPWLMLPYCEEVCNENRFCRGFFSISGNKVHHLVLPEAYGGCCVGSSFGWLVMLEISTASIFLLNPITRCRIDLPPLTTFPDIVKFQLDDVGREYTFLIPLANLHEYMSLEEMEHMYMQKVILSEDPTTGNCMVMALCSVNSQFGFCRPGDEQWTLVESSQVYDDLLYWRNQLYGVDCSGNVTVCEIGVSSPKETLVIKRPAFSIGGETRYLAEDSFGELLMIVRHFGWYDRVRKTSRFEIYKVDKETKDWEKATSLGDYMLFLGYSCALCLLAREFPHCKANSVYFTDYYVHESAPHGDLGIFCLEDDSIERFSCCPDEESSRNWPAPLGSRIHRYRYLHLDPLRQTDRIQDQQLDWIAELVSGVVHFFCLFQFH